MMKSASETLDVRQAAALLHLNEKRVQSLARSGRLPGFRVGRKWLFPRSALERLVGTTESANQGAEITDSFALSARNRLVGRVRSVVVEGLMAEVRLQIGDQELTAVITRSSAERLRLREGDEAFAVIKSTEVMIGKSGVRS
jgi:molybdopterin-binding protein